MLSKSAKKGWISCQTKIECYKIRTKNDCLVYLSAYWQITNYLNFRKIGQNLCKFVVETLLCEFHFSHVKRTNARNFVVAMNHRRSFALSSRQNDIDEVLHRRHCRDTFEVVLLNRRHLVCVCVCVRLRRRFNVNQSIRATSEKTEAVQPYEWICSESKSKNCIRNENETFREI